MAETKYNDATGQWAYGSNTDGWTVYEDRDQFIKAQGNEPFMAYIQANPRFAAQPGQIGMAGGVVSGKLGEAREAVTPYIQKGLEVLAGLPLAGPNPGITPEQETARRSSIKSFSEGVAPYLNPVPADLPSAAGMAAGIAAAPFTAGMSIPASMTRSALMQGSARAMGAALEGGSLEGGPGQNPAVQFGQGVLESTLPYVGRGIEQGARQAHGLATSGKVVNEVIDWANDKLKPLIGKTLPTSKTFDLQQLALDGGIVRTAGSKLEKELNSILKMTVVPKTGAFTGRNVNVSAIRFPMSALGVDSQGNPVKASLPEIFEAVRKVGFSLPEGVVPKTKVELMALSDRNDLLKELSNHLRTAGFGSIDKMYRQSLFEYGRVRQIRDYLQTAADPATSKLVLSELQLQYNMGTANIPSSAGDGGRLPKQLENFGRVELKDLATRLGRGTPLTKIDIAPKIPGLKFFTRRGTQFPCVASMVQGSIIPQVAGVEFRNPGALERAAIPQLIQNVVGNARK